jgi:hypothetical protein
MPEGWDWTQFQVFDGESNLYLESDRARGHPVKVLLAPNCDPGDSSKVPSDELDTERFERISAVSDSYVGTRFYVFEGGCVTYDFDFQGVGRTALAEQASTILGFQRQADIAAEIEERQDVDPFE